MLTRLLSIRPGEGILVLRLGLHGFFIIGAAMIFGAAGEGLFISSYPAEWLPYVYLGGAAVSLLFSILYEKLQSRLNSLSVAFAVVIGSSILLALCVFPVHFFPKIGPFLLYLVVPGCVVIGSLERSGLVSRTLDIRASRRLLPTIGILMSLGAFSGGFLVGVLSPYLGVPAMIWFAIGYLLATLFFVRGGKSKKKEKPTVKPASWGNVLKHHYALLLVIIVFSASLLGTFVDYQLGACLKVSLEPDKIAPFLGFLKGGLSIGAFLFSLLLSRPLIARFGVGSTLGLHSFGVLSTTLFCIVSPILAASAAIFLIHKLLLQNFHKPLLNISVMPLPDALRSKAILVIGGALDSPATAVGCLLIIATSSFLPWYGYAYAISAIASIALVCALLARKLYTQEVANAMRSRRFRMSEDEEQPIEMDAKSLAVIHQQLKSDNPDKIVLALHLLEGRCSATTMGVIQIQWSQWVDWIKKEAIKRLSIDPIPELFRFFEEIFPEESEPVRAKLMRSRLVKIPSEELERLVREGRPKVMAEAMVCLLQERGAAFIRPQLEEWIHSHDSQLHRSAAYVIGHTEQDSFWEMLPQLVSDAPLEVAQTVVKRPNSKFAEICVTILNDDRAFPYARDALLQMGEEARELLLKETKNPERMVSVLQVLGGLQDPETRHALIEMLEESDEDIRFRVIKAVAQKPATTEEEKFKIRRAIEVDLEICRRSREQAYASEDLFLKDTAMEEFEWSSKRIFLLLPLLYPGKPFEKIYLSFFSEDANQRSFALEALDEMLDKDLGQQVLKALEETGEKQTKALEETLWEPVTEEKSPAISLAMQLKQSDLFKNWRLSALKILAEKSLACDGNEGQIILKGGKTFELEKAILGQAFQKPSGEDVISLSLGAIYETIESRSRCGPVWLQSIASQMPQPGREVGAGGKKELSIDGRIVANELAESEKLALWEKIFLLRSVPLFRGLTAEHLHLVAEIARLVAVDAGSLIVAEGEPGYLFYVIASGAVMVSLQEKTLAQLGGAEAFGELAILTGEKRTASVRAVEACDLLAIDQIDFLDLVYTHPTLVKPFAAMIAQRILENKSKGI